MSRLVRAELRRLLGTRLWIIGLLVAALTGTGLIGMMVLVGTENFDPPMPGLDTRTGIGTVAGMLGYTTFVPVVLGTLAITSEYRHRTIDVTFLFAPRRWQVLLAKLVTYGGFGLAYGLLLAATGATALLAGTALRGVSLGLSTLAVLELFGRLALTMAVHMLIGVGIGALLRNQVAALAAVLGYFYLLEPMLSIIPGVSRLYPYLPAGATAALTGFDYLLDEVATQLGAAPVPLLSPLGGGLLLAGYVLVAALLAVAVPLRRDVS